MLDEQTISVYSGIMKRGFTLIELLVTISIISVLTAIGLANYSVSQKRARDARRQADLESVRSALEIYRADNLATGYPNTNYAGLSASLIPNYLSQLPLDPKNVSPYTYTYAGGGNTYTICANQLERTAVSYCLTPP